MPAAILTRALAAGWLVRVGHRAIRVEVAAGPALARLGMKDSGVRSLVAPDAAEVSVVSVVDH